MRLRQTKTLHRRIGAQVVWKFGRLFGKCSGKWPGKMCVAQKNEMQSETMSSEIAIMSLGLQWQK
jgi:hypothetical protein